MSSPSTSKPPRPDIGDALNDEHNIDASSSTALHIAPKNATYFHRMLNLCKEIAIMLLIATVYAAITNETPPKVGKSPAAYPFFPHSSLIKDWYRGQVGAAIEQVRMHDVSFVMFYAPWDAASQAAREQFEITAEVMGHRVAFASVNCWQPGSECKRQYGKVFKWPVLIAYPTHGRGVQYNGPLQATHMVRFLENMCKPLIRASRAEEIVHKHDEVIAAEIDSRPRSLQYAVFYTAALRFLERDPSRDIPFVVLPRDGAEPTLKLYLWNETLIYNGNWETEQILGWILRNVRFLVNWIAPSGVKSKLLSEGLQMGPSLLLFTPKNPLAPHIDYYDLMREVAYDYNNCDNITYYNVKRLRIHEERLKNRLAFYNLEAKCASMRLLPESKTQWGNFTTKTYYCSEKKRDSLGLEHSSNYDQCKMFQLAQEQYFARNIDSQLFNITGLACRTNQTLRFISMDSVNYHHFAETLGLSLDLFPGKSAAVIINEKAESHYILQEDVTSASLRRFIHNFTWNGLERSLKSHTNVQNRRWSHRYPVGVLSSPGIVAVSELTSETFLKTVGQHDRAVLVFYYSKQCAFCSGISHVFLTVARLLKSVTEVQLSRIDGDTNLLSWEYTMHNYPTILLFPRWEKSESRALPQTLPITVPNLLSFLLVNLDPVLKLKVMNAICENATIASERSKCLQSVRMETLNLIGRTLREWRRALPGKRGHVMRTLQVLKQLHLVLGHVGSKEAVQTHLGRLKGRDEL